MMRDWHPEIMHPDPGTPDGMRTMLAARYRHLSLKFTIPAQPGAGLYGATWAGAQAEAESEDELLQIVLQELQDCGAETHDWITVSEAPDPLSQGNILRTQRLQCAYCDTRERVITVPGDAQERPR